MWKHVERSPSRAVFVTLTLTNDGDLTKHSRCRYVLSGVPSLYTLFSVPRRWK